MWESVTTWLGKTETTNSLMVFFTALLVLTQLVQGFSNWIAARAAMRSAEIGQQTLVAAHRAFIYLKNFQPWLHLAKYVGGSTRIESWDFAPRWINNGQTDIRNGRAHTNAKGFPVDGVPIPFDFTDIPNTESKKIGSLVYLGPQSEVLGAPFSIPLADLLEVHQKRNRIFFWGWIEYDDVFGSSHRTEYFHELQVIGDPRVNNPQHFLFVMQATHNETKDNVRRTDFP